MIYRRLKKKLLVDVIHRLEWVIERVKQSGDSIASLQTDVGKRSNNKYKVQLMNYWFLHLLFSYSGVPEVCFLAPYYMETIYYCQPGA